jgi:hypothetical protein
VPTLNLLPSDVIAEAGVLETLQASQVVNDAGDHLISSCVNIE